MYHSFDTLDVAKNFVKSGMKVGAAEAVAKAIAASRDADFNHLATKVDIMELEGKLEKLEARLEAKFEARFSEVERKISELAVSVEKGKNETLRWYIGMNIATISILMAFFKLFIH